MIIHVTCDFVFRFKHIVEMMEEYQLDVPLVDKIVGYFIASALVNQCMDESAVKELYRYTKPTLATKLSQHITEIVKQHKMTAKVKTNKNRTSQTNNTNT
jgi:predicted chitinase